MRDHQKKLIIYVIILAVATVMWPRLSVFADEDFTSNYNQRTFSDTDGFDSGEANCVCQSVSGYIWIGTPSAHLSASLFCQAAASDCPFFRMDSKV